MGGEAPHTLMSNLLKVHHSYLGLATPLSLSAGSTSKLQKLQNNAIRLIYNAPPRSSVSEKYEELEVLRIDQCVQSRFDCP